MDLTADNERNIIQQEYVNFLDDDVSLNTEINLVILAATKSHIEMLEIGMSNRII